MYVWRKNPRGGAMQYSMYVCMYVCLYVLWKELFCRNSRGISKKYQYNKTDKVYPLSNTLSEARERKKEEMLGCSEDELYHGLLLVDPEAAISLMVFLAFAPVWRFFVIASSLFLFFLLTLHSPYKQIRYNRQSVSYPSRFLKRCTGTNRDNELWRVKIVHHICLVVL